MQPIRRWWVTQGDAREVLQRLKDHCVDCIITSPPYWGMRNYGDPERELGAEERLEQYLDGLVGIMEECRRVLKRSGTCWLVMGDRYSGGRRASYARKQKGTRSLMNDVPRRNPDSLPGKSLVGLPWRIAFRMQEAGWILRAEIVWNKVNCLPESVKDRPTRSHETIFLFAKSPRYYYGWEDMLEPLTCKPEEKYPYRSKILGRGQQHWSKVRGRDRDKSGGFPPSRLRSGNLERKIGGEDRAQSHRGYSIPWESPGFRNGRDVWDIAVKPTFYGHPAPFPEELARKMVLGGCPPGGLVLDPFCGISTAGVAALTLGRDYFGIDLHEKWVTVSRKRIRQELGLFSEESAEILSEIQVETGR